MNILEKRCTIRENLLKTKDVWLKNLEEKESQLAIQQEILRSPEAQSDRSENAVYQTAIEAVRLLDIDIKNINHKLTAFSQFFGNEYVPDGTIQLGSTCVLHCVEVNRTFDVYVVPADLGLAKIGAISTKSPVGKGLIGMKQGETLTVSTLQGTLHYNIEEVY